MMCDLVLLLMMRRAAGKATKGAIMVRILLLPKELAAEFTDKIGQNFDDSRATKYRAFSDASKGPLMHVCKWPVHVRRKVQRGRGSR